MDNALVDSWTGCDGSIIRIYLKNFLTYSECEVFPGPNLNVIYGPNGSGKSSIVCAICLGLGGEVSFLNRAKELKNFVKFGEQEAIIEIDLYRDKVVSRIKRVISVLKPRSSFWCLNGNLIPEAQIIKHIHSMGIYINNLCQTLPQDRVADFAKLNSHGLLLNLEKSVFIKDFNLHETHLKLININDEIKKSDQVLKNNKNELEKIKSRIENLKIQVQQIQIYDKMQNELSLLQQKHAWNKYHTEKKTFEEMQTKNLQLIRDLEQADKLLAPINQELTQVVENIERIKANFPNYHRKNSDLLKENERHISKIEDSVGMIKNAKIELDQIKKLYLENEKLAVQFRQQLVGLEEKLVESKENYDPSLYDSLQSRINSNQNEFKELTLDYDKLKTDFYILKNKQDRLTAKKQEFHDRSKQQMDLLNRTDNHTYQAVLWLRSNQHLFKEPIIEPMILQIRLTDPNYAKYIESHIPRRDFFTFLATNHDDLSKFIGIIREEKNLRVSVAPINKNMTLEAYRKAAHSVDNLASFGFDRFLIDTIDGCESVILYLCQYYRIHTVPILRTEDDQLLEKLTHNKSHNCFYTTNNKYVVRHSVYSKKPVSMVSPLKQDKFLLQQSKSSEINKIDRELNEMNNSISSYQKQATDLEENINKKRQLLDDLKRKRTTILDHRIAITGIETKIKSIQEKLKNTGTNSDVHKKIQDKKQSISQLNARMIDSIHESLSNLFSVQQVGFIDDLMNDKIDLTLEENKKIKIKQDIEVCKEQFRKLKEQQAKINELISKQKVSVETSLNTAKGISNIPSYHEIPSKLKKKLDNLPSENEILDERIDELRSRINCNANLDRSIVDDYKKYMEQAQTLESLIKESDCKLNSNNKMMTDLSDKWFSKLESLINRINEKFVEYFNRMNCRAELRLISPQCDYENYGLEIWVSYRQDQEMTRLDSMRQSGGEKSVATILFLLALQRISHAPVRIVDEINQGMDEANERLTFKIMVETIGSNRSSQYFCLSPKALPDLTYGPNMNILTIFNGPNIEK